MKKLILSIFISIFLSFANLGVASTDNGGKGTAVVNSTGLYIDGKPFHLLAGEIHYFRVLPQYWRDRLLKLKACGLNTVSTYCPWSAHEPKQNTFDFSGNLNVREFLEICKELDIKVMFRPGPYICSEWDFGGLPWWLLKDSNIVIRSRDPKFYNPASAYMKRILKEAEPYFCNNGGPIVAIQIENGYASYGNDKKYIENLRDLVLETGFKGIIYTADGDSPTRLNANDVKGVWRTLMCGTNLEKSLDFMSKIQPNTPQIVSELWSGQGIKLKTPMRVRNIEKLAEEIDTILAKKYHLVLYMFHGGRTGITSGVSRTPTTPFIPFVSSYDTDALIDESGYLKPKYFAFRNVFLKYNPDASKYPIPPNPEKASYGNIEFSQYASMLDNLENLTTKTQKSFRMLSMEEMDQGFGFIHYSTKIEKPLFPLNITLQGISDYAWVDFEGERKAEFSHDSPDTSINVDVPENGGKLDILVENQGRINFSLVMDKNRKGILGGVVLNKQMFHSNWTMRSLPLSNLEKISWQAIPSNKQQIKYPAFFKAKLSIKNPKDTYLTFGKSGRGYCWINGYQLARYDKTSPLITMHIPAALLKSGENTIEILELENADLSNIKSVDEPIGNVKGEIKVLK